MSDPHAVEHRGASALADLVEVDVRGRRAEAKIVKPPFVESHVR